MPPLCHLAARAIVTVPLGVLKHGDVEFQPPLPEAEADAIAALGFGVLDKVQALGPLVPHTAFSILIDLIDCKAPVLEPELQRCCTPG